MSPTAHRALLDRAATAVAAVAAVVVALLAGQSDGRLQARALVAMLLTAAVGAAAVSVTTRRWGRALLAELERGYTTTTFTTGRFWMGAAPDAPHTLGKIQWDWRGVWVLRTTGEVVSPPSPELDPPGIYPSPNRPGAQELWTGHQWTCHFPG